MITRSVCHLGSCLSKHVNISTVCLVLLPKSVPDMVIRFFSEDFEGETL